MSPHEFMHECVCVCEWMCAFVSWLSAATLSIRITVTTSVTLAAVTIGNLQDVMLRVRVLQTHPPL